jgi:hypothetical protein
MDRRRNFPRGSRVGAEDSRGGPAIENAPPARRRDRAVLVRAGAELELMRDMGARPNSPAGSVRRLKRIHLLLIRSNACREAAIYCMVSSEQCIRI